MKKSVQLKMDRIIALSKESKPVVKGSTKAIAERTDSLSAAIRSKRDADIFMQELRSAFRSANKK